MASARVIFKIHKHTETHTHTHAHMHIYTSTFTGKLLNKHPGPRQQVPTAP